MYCCTLLCFHSWWQDRSSAIEDVADEIHSRRNTLEQLAKGLRRFIVGLSKKLLIADICGNVVALIYNADRSVLDSRTAWLAAVCYLMQIYFDFSGYSDMAIGLGLCFGFHFKENFNYPYISASIQEFWRRWHISLSTWFREYLYIPLGGNRKGKAKTYWNKLIVFFCTGLWHGANWTFIVWGLWHGFFIVAEDAVKKLFGLEKHGKGGRNPACAVLKHLYTLLVVLVGFVIFRADNMGQAFSMIGAMFSGGLCLCADRAAAGAVSDPADPVCTGGWPCGQYAGFAAGLP